MGILCLRLWKSSWQTQVVPKMDLPSSTLISLKLVHKSVSDSYLVGSRGSVGSSLVATPGRVCEVNPTCTTLLSKLPILRVYRRWFQLVRVMTFTGQDCPHCGHALVRDGRDIPFETFLGFYGDLGARYRLNSGAYPAARPRLLRNSLVKTMSIGRELFRQLPGTDSFRLCQRLSRGSPILTS